MVHLLQSLQDVIVKSFTSVLTFYISDEYLTKTLESIYSPAHLPDSAHTCVQLTLSDIM